MSYKKITLLLLLGMFLSGEREVSAQMEADTFNYTGAIQTWVVPCAVSVTVTVDGAQGGTGIYGNGGLGAEIAGTFTVTPGDVLDVLVGQQGVGGPVGANYFYCGSGGGGSYVWNSANSSLPMVVAGGGGGEAWQSTAGGGSSTATTTASVGGGSSAAGGTGGAGGTGSASGGGGGWISNGTAGTYGGGGQDPANGGAGGTGGNPGVAGGYGGGGGCGGNDGAGGGGGGYNGGGGGTVNNDWGAGGGGGSYNAGANQINTASIRSGNGRVIISWERAVLVVTDSVAVLANEVTCDGMTGMAKAKANGVGLSYSWTGGQTGDTATGLSAGSYTVTVTSVCGSSASAAITITQPVNAITASSSVVTNVSCHGGSNGSAIVTATGVGTPYTYSWSDGQITALANGLTAGNYSVEVTNACGATATAAATITEPPSLNLSAITTWNVLCYGGNNGSGSATAHSGTPPYAYSWAPAGGITDTAVGLVAGSYTITLRDANGCTGSTSIVITQPNMLTVTTSVNNEVLCYGTNTGNMIANVNAGTGPYTYAWTGGQTNVSASGISAGTYTVNVTDNHGCTASAGGVVTQPTPLQVVENTTLDSGACTGTAWINVTGGVDPYNYLWSNGNITYYTHYVCHDTFCYKVTDQHGCADSGCIYVPTDLGITNVGNKVGNLKVYPNPSNGQFTIESLVAGGQWRVEVYNVLGEKVYTQSNIQNSTFNINLGSQPNGIYLYRVISSDSGNLLGEGKLEITR